MKYINAESVLPEALIKEIQKYTQGFCVYIPLDSKKKGWGENSGSKDSIKTRNAAIRDRFRLGHSVEALAEAYFLSHHSIKKIVYVKEP